jgi:hypothetical protein
MIDHRVKITITDKPVNGFISVPLTMEKRDEHVKVLWEPVLDILYEDQGNYIA